MLTCSNCGASVREGARFCTTCGTRLNDPVTSNATNVWATSGSGDTAASTSAATPDPVWTEAASDDERADGVDAAPAVENQPDQASDVNEPTPPAPDDAFNWSWGSPATANDAGTNQGADEVEVESGVVPDESDAVRAEPNPDEVVDATEIEILDVDENEAETDAETASVEPTPDPETSDALLVVDDEDGARREETETLAAWAEQWETPDADDDAPAEEPGTEPAPTAATTEPEHAALAARGESSDADADADEEDTVARAERLIGELQAIIPTLARPMTAAPAAPGVTFDTAALAGELEGAARAGQFDDLRDVLQAARANPRDVDTMLSLSGRVDRLLELLDDRDQLARVSEGAAARLRPASAEPES